MNNNLKSKTRLSFIQIIFQHLSTKNDVNEILNIFNKNYKSTFVENLDNKKKIQFEFNTNFLKKLVNYYIEYIDLKNFYTLINIHINFNRKFEKWDLINQSILLAAFTEVKNSENAKSKIILNDYLNISKFFINQSDVKIINAVLDKLINDKKN